MIHQKYRSHIPSRLVAVGVALAVGAAGLAATPHSHADVVTISTDTGRSGWDPNEPSLSPGSVTSSDFGQLYSTALTGQIYAQPLVIGSTVIAATEENHVYGLDRATGAIKWSVDFGPSWPSSTVACGDLVPDVGVTSTPVYDPSSGYLYVTAKVNDGASVNDPHYYLHALNATTGAERPGWPLLIQGSPSNDRSNTFAARDQLQRPGLLLQNGSVYLGFGSLCDVRPFRGYVVGVNTSTQAMHMWASEVGTNVSGASVWQAGGGIVSDGNGGMFVATGNGVSGPPGPGTSPPGLLAESVIHLAVAPNGTISAKDYFSPTEATYLDSIDADVGSGGPIALPDAEFGTKADPHLMVELGKEGKLYLLNRDNLGGRGQGPGGGDKVLEELQLPDEWGHPAVWGGDGGYVYVTETSGYIEALSYGQTATGSPTLNLAANSAELFGYGSGSPVVTSDGTTSGSAVVWVVQSPGADGIGHLLAYDAVPSHHTLKLLRSWPLGATTKFSVPATDNGNLYVGTNDGHLIAFGMPTNQALQGSPVAFGDDGVGSAKTATATLTATKTVTVSAVTADAPFAITSPTLPVTLTAGQTISLPVSFTPTTWGAARGQIHLTTDAGTIDVGLTGTGTQPGLASSPASLDYGGTGIDSSRTLTFSVQNTGATAEKFTGVTSPDAPFTASALPAVGDTLAPGATRSISVAYAPTVIPSDPASNDTASIVLNTDQGTVTIPLTGAAQVAHAQVAVSTTSMSFGTVAINGSAGPQTFTLTNTGNVTATVTKTVLPGGGFTTLNPIPAGLQLAPGESYPVAIKFSAIQPADYSGTYTITTDTGQDPIAVNMSATCALPPRIPLTSIGGGWTLNGSARMAGTNLELSPSDTHKAGDAVDGTPVPSAGLTASFTAQLTGGAAGDGLTFGLLDATTSTATALGGTDDGLGFAGLSGVAVVLGTHRQSGIRSDNFVGVATTTPGSNGGLTYLATSTNIPSLRTGTHTVSVQVTGNQLDVSVDGTLVLSPTVTLPASVLPAFTAGTGRDGAHHVVSGVTIASGGAAVPAPGGGWSYNGSASASGQDTQLTPAAPHLAGTVTYSQPIQVQSMALRFTTVIGGGTGGDGLTFSLFDASAATASQVGRAGNGLGAAGIPGISFTLNTGTSGKQVPNVAVETEPVSGTTPALQFDNAALPNLIGTHTWWVMFSGGLMIVTMDGALVLRGNVTLPASVLPSFTASTGSATDNHVVRDASLWFR